MAASFYKLETFQEILNWAKDNLTREEVSKLFFATDNEGRSVFHKAAGFIELEIFQEILKWANRI